MYTKHISFFLLGFLGALLAIVVWFFVLAPGQPLAPSPDEIKESRSERLADSLGRVSALANIALADKAALEAKNKELSRLLGASGRKIKEVESNTSFSTETRIVTTTRVRDSVVMVFRDSVIARSFEYEDPYLSYRGVVVGDDSANLEILVRDTFSVSTAWIKPKGWLKKPQLYVYVRSASPYSDVTTAKAYRAPAPPRGFWRTGVGRTLRDVSIGAGAAAIIF